MNKEEIIEEDKTKLQIGCGWKPMKGFINIDKSDVVKPDIVVNIEKGLPFSDNSFSYIYSSHCLEHTRPEYWEFILSEISRVAKNGCLLELDLPFDNKIQRSHANHYRVFDWDSFHCYEEKSVHGYYSKFVIINLLKRPNMFYRAWFNIFDFAKKNVHFKFKIVKKENK